MSKPTTSTTSARWPSCRPTSPATSPLLPGEIEPTIETARGFATRVVAVFQPHLYSRTAALAADFGRSLCRADIAVITDVFAARESPVPGVTGKLVVDAAAEACPGLRVV